MKINLTYESQTGNTEAIARAIREALPDTITFSSVEEADLIFIGSWTDKGDCAESIRDLLPALKNKKIAWFGTCGFGGSDEYYDRLVRRIRTHLDPSSTLLGAFYCPGKMPESVKERYVALLQDHPEDSRLQVSLKNYEEVKDRPNASDMEHAKNWTGKILKEVTQ